MGKGTGFRQAPHGARVAHGGLARIVRALALAAVLLTGASTEADAFYIQLHGVVTEYFSGDPLQQVQVRIVKDSIERETAFTTRNGRYEFFLDRGYDYLIWFHKPGMVTKYIRIDAREIPLIPDVPFYEMYVQMTMFVWLDGMDYSLLDQPVGMAYYKHSVRNLSWNIEYTDQLRPQVLRLMEEYVRHQARLDKARREKDRKAVKRRRKMVVF